MAKYQRLFVYKRNAEPPQQILIQAQLTMIYHVVALAGKNLSVIYNILNADAKTVYTEKVVEKTTWSEADPSDPTQHNE